MSVRTEPIPYSKKCSNEHCPNRAHEGSCCWVIVKNPVPGHSRPEVKLFLCNPCAEALLKGVWNE